MYSENSLLLEGDRAEIQRFVLQAKCMCEYEKEFPDETDFHFDKFISTPERLSNWKEWRLSHWGITYEMKAHYDKDKQTYYFDTEFDCDDEFPIRGFVTVSKQFPKIKFIYESYKLDIQDVDMALHNRIEFCNGIIESEEKNKVRVKRCSHCNRPGSYERISGEERANG